MTHWAWPLRSDPHPRVKGPKGSRSLPSQDAQVPDLANIRRPLPDQVRDELRQQSTRDRCWYPAHDLRRNSSDVVVWPGFETMFV